jgi:hypothetical protein
MPQGSGEREMILHRRKQREAGVSPTSSHLHVTGAAAVSVVALTGD